MRLSGDQKDYDRRRLRLAPPGNPLNKCYVCPACSALQLMRNIVFIKGFLSQRIPRNRYGLKRIPITGD